MRRVSRALVLATVLLACHESLVVLPPPVPVATLTVNPAHDTVVEGDSVQLTAVARDSAGQVIANATVTWTSDSLAFASVTRTGLVRTTFPGLAPIIASAGAKADTVAVTVAPVQLVAPTAGGHHTCARTNGGAIYCWGRDLYGQLGSGFVSVGPETAPIPVASTSRYSAVAAGENHTCAVGQSGAAFCWGNNAASQLGSSGGPSANPVPSAVTGGHAFRTLVAGDRHSCGLGTDSVTYCWGANDAGQLGDSLPGSGGPNPVRVAAPHPFVLLAAGGVHSCAVSAALAYCWGGNANGELGDGTDSTRRSPVVVRDLVEWLDVTAGTNHTCGRVIDYSARCWGKNDHGQLGTGQADSLARRPVVVSGGRSWIMLAAGGAHTCGIASDSLAYCWGANGSGQLGDSSFLDRPAPVPVHGGIHFSWITAGDAHTCAFSTTAAVYCWGDNGDGELGDHTTTARPAPVLVRP
jgi:alpha-tubulin suppressor-like RCC1 family protein